MAKGVQVIAPEADRGDDILTDEALDFLGKLARSFEGRRQGLMSARIDRQAEIDSGARPNFLESTRHIRDGNWVVPAAPEDLALC